MGKGILYKKIFAKSSGSGVIAGSGTAGDIAVFVSPTVIGSGTWAFTGNTLYPKTTGSDIGDATHRISTIFMSSTINFGAASNLQFSENGSVIATVNGNGFGVGLTPASGIRFSVQGSGSTDATTSVEIRNSGTQILFKLTDGRGVDLGLNGFSDSTGQIRFGYGSTITGSSNGTAFGFGATCLALQSVVVGDLARSEDHSTMIGAETGKLATGFSYNDGFGYRALYQNNGSFNVGVGTFAFQGNISGSYGIAVGHQAGYYEPGSNSLYIHNSLGVSDTATGKTNSIIYGVMNATNTSQQLFLNVGRLSLRYIPTSAAGLTAGDVWNDAGTLRIA